LVIARAPGSSAVSTAVAHDLLVGDSRGTFAYEVSATGSGEIRTTVLQPLEGPIERAGLRRIAEPSAPGADAGYVLEERLLHLAATADPREAAVEIAPYQSGAR